MAWYGVRSVYLFGCKSDGTTIFEERVVCFEAAGSAEALEKGRRESLAYAKENGVQVFAERESYEQDGAALVEGCEVWSVLFEAKMTLEEFYQDRYRRFEYRPE